MINIHKFLVILGIVFMPMRSNSQSIPQEDLIKKFLLNLESDNWTLDTIIAEFVDFKPIHNKGISTDERKRILNEALDRIGAELKERKIDVNKLMIEKYSDAEPSLKKMMLSEDEVKQTFIAVDKDKKYIHYFLLSDTKIKSFTTFKEGKVFIIL
jgi:hypothetical protein